MTITPEACLFNALGIIGSVLLLFGFYRISIGKWTDKSFWYEFDNAFGAILIITYQIKYHAFVSVVVNFIWFVVAAYGLVMFVKRSHTHIHKRQVRNKRAKRK